MKVKIPLLIFFLTFSLIFSCKQEKKAPVDTPVKQEKVTETTNNQIATQSDLLLIKPDSIGTPEGMVWIPGGIFTQGAVPQDGMAMGHEKPAHQVAIDGFFMDATEVTNAQFKKFIDATGYKTLAERAPDWEEMKSQLPPGTPKPHDSIMQAGSLTFKKTKSPVNDMRDFSQWWGWRIGASWKNPNGPGTSIKDKMNHPVVHIAYEDALAYCKWANRRLPTEAEWERGARGKKVATYSWGDDESVLTKKANTWEGQFPVTNTKDDGFEQRAPVKSYEPNDFGLYDMAGNVWEWTSDWYNTKYYTALANSGGVVINPKGADSPYNERDRYAREKIMKGGSFLCNASYCASYRSSSRMATSLDSSLEHLGFRTVATLDMIENLNK